MGGGKNCKTATKCTKNRKTVSKIIKSHIPAKGETFVFLNDQIFACEMHFGAVLSNLAATELRARYDYKATEKL